MADEPHDHDRGLAFDLSTLLNRRRALQLFGGAGLVALVGCASKGGSSATATSAAASGSSATTNATTATTAAGTATTAAAATTAASTDTSTPIPEETAGPFPGDGSNGPNILTQSGIVRSDIRPSFGSANGLAQGVPLTISLQVLDTANGSAPMAGAAVYVWHCDIDGNYSMYSQGVTNENYLRGVQETDSNGNVTFTSIFPAAYSGRWPHIHFEVYPSLAEATKAGTKLATSQMAMPKETCDLVYATDGYNQSVRNLSQTSLATDMVFRDGWDHELGTITGTIDSGLTATLAAPV
jgi:protocatechuate 3,4-dioxygenase beta subunit